MSREASALREAFLADHRRLTRGLLRLLDALRENDLPAARAVADEIDQVAGPHMEFEESVFYPALENLLGSNFVDQLYREHSEGQEAVRALKMMRESATLAPVERRSLIDHVETALEHALSCGSLLSHLEVLGEQTKETMLERLLELRDRGRRWTDLPTKSRSRSI